MSVCTCPYYDEVLGTKLWKNRTARSIPKSGNICPLCETAVDIGEKCTDFAGLWYDESGWFSRMHADCFELMELFANKLCGGDWSIGSFDFDEASDHAMANSDDPYWREWLEKYELVWNRLPEPADPLPIKRSGVVEPIWRNPSETDYLERLADLPEEE